MTVNAFIPDIKDTVGVLPNTLPVTVLEEISPAGFVATIYRLYADVLVRLGIVNGLAGASVIVPFNEYRKVVKSVPGVACA